MKANRLVVTLGLNKFADMLALLRGKGDCERSNQVKV
ncbi:MAG: hypothetical protein RL659_815 [Pseudomonadota bacterium]|jgi:hypothetical protein